MCGPCDILGGELGRRPLIVVLDQDEALREALRFSLETEGYRVRAFGAADDLAACSPGLGAACLVIDEAAFGPALRTMLRGRRAPVILLSGRPERARRLWPGSRATVVEKPLVTDALSRRIAAALRANNNNSVFPGECRGPDSA